MTFLQIFLTISIIVNTWICMMWTTRGFINLCFKFAFLALAVTAGALLGTELGFIVKV